MATKAPTGHRIRDAAGTLMPQRFGLWFRSGFTVTDDPATGRTVIDATGGGGGGTTSYAAIAKWGVD